MVPPSPGNDSGVVIAQRLPYCTAMLLAVCRV